MPIQLPTPNSHIRHGEWTGPRLLAATVVIAGTAATSVLIWTLPSPLVLPAIGLLAIATAIAVASIAWATAQRMTAIVGYWDIAGALTFVGIAAALLSDPELVIPLLEQQRTE